MWEPARMKQVQMVFLDSALEPVVREMGAAGSLDIFEVGELGDWARQLEPLHLERLSAEYDGMEDRLRSIAGALEVDLNTEITSSDRIDPQAAAWELNERIGAIESDYIHRARDERETANREGRLGAMLRELQFLAPLEIDLQRLRDLHYLHMVAGLIPLQNLSRLRGSLSGLSNTVVQLAAYDGRQLIIAFSRPEDGDAMDRALRAANVERIEIPPELVGAPRAALPQIQEQMARAGAEHQQTVARIHELGEAKLQELNRIHGSLRLNRLVLEAEQKFRRTARTFLAAGWVAEDRLSGFEQQVADACSGCYALSIAGAPPGQAEEGPSVPTALRNPPLLRPFEGLVTNYGLPSYWELDPTPVSTILFLVFFGVMFGDVGQGLVLAGLGLALAKRWILPSFSPLGWILFASGLSSSLFGIFYGNVFDVETIIPPLIIRPSTNVLFFVGVAVAFGAIVVSLGVMINMVVAFRNRDWQLLLLDKYGLAGLLFYWGLVLFGLSFLHIVLLPIYAILPVIIIPLAAVYLGEPLARLFSRRAEDKSPVEATYYVESAVEVFDMGLRFLSNTLSFLRLAAFALAHFALAAVFFTLAALLSTVPLWPAFMLIVGNIFIITFEGIIVSIQSLRLEYYEFYSKFFLGNGRPYQPFSLPLSGQKRSRQ